MSPQAPFDSPADVLVVGAGPTGLAAAVSLIIQGCGKVVVVDSLPEGQNTSRAAVIHALTLETLEYTGAVPALLAKGIHSLHATIFHGESILLQFPFEQLDSKYKFTLMISQADTEKILATRLKELGGSIYWSKKVVGISNVHESLKAVKFEGGEVLTAKYIVAADGLHSAVREEAGIPYVDPTPGRKPDDFVMQLCLVDIRLSTPPDKSEAFAGYFSPQGLLGLIPLPDGSIRMFAGFPKSMEVPKNPDLAFVQNLMKERGVNKSIESVIWGSRFRVRSRIAETFFLPGKNGEGAMLLAGDAAHTHSPAGGQGMNLGLCDGVLLAAAVKQHMESHDDEILHRYSRERKSRALHIIAMSETMTKFGASIAGWKGTLMRWIAWTMGHIPAFTRAAATEMSGIKYRN